MRYYGGKKNKAKRIAKCLIKVYRGDVKRRKRGKIRNYVEPFCGGMEPYKAMVPFLTKHKIRMYASDGNPDTICLWKDTQSGIFENPGHITREKWYELKAQKQASALRAYAGHGYSYMAIPFGGYLEDAYRTKDYLYNDVMRTGSICKNVHFRHCDYKNALKGVKGRCLIYCDPPYNDSSYRYNSTFDFDHREFLKQILKWRKMGHIVVVSETNLSIGKMIDETKQFITKTRSRFSDKLYLITKRDISKTRT